MYYTRTKVFEIVPLFDKFSEPLALSELTVIHSGMYGISFDPDSRISQYKQLVEQLRGKITNGTISGGTRLASTRELSERLGIARGIVLEAVDQLKMEGYLDTVHGSGTFVRHGLVWESGSLNAHVSTTTDAPRVLSARKRDEGSDFLSFAPGMPDMSLFPRRHWLTCYHDALEYASLDDLGYCSPCGQWQLRTAIARHLLEVKGIKTGAERIVVTAGASQAFALLAGIFPHPRVVMEDPHAPFIRRVFDGLGCAISYVPVDDEGMREDLISNEAADLIYVTPTHQFPVGGTLSAERRIALLGKARDIGAWIIEDDFDSEFRYDRNPVTPLQVMASERVIYVGTFSKTVSPALRIGFMVVPPGIQARVKTLKRRWDFWNEGLQQKAMALFIERGYLARHLARSHRAYRRKNEYLKGLVAARLAPLWRVTGSTTGMHLIIRHSLKDGSPADVAPVVTELAKLHIEAEPLSDYCHVHALFRDSLIIAFGNRSLAELERLIDAIASL